MTIPQQVLSDEQIEEIDNAHNWQTTAGRAAAYRAIESATLKAVSGQEPVAWMWQHDETGRTGFVAADQLAMGWQSANPRLQIVAPCYALPPAQPAPVDERVAFEAWYDAFEFRREYDKYGPTEAAWSAWQARAALQCAQAPQAKGDEA